MSGDLESLTNSGFRAVGGEDHRGEEPPYYSGEQLDSRCLYCDPLKCHYCHGNRVDPIAFYGHLRDNCQEGKFRAPNKDDLKECAWRRHNVDTLENADSAIGHSKRIGESVRKLVSSSARQASTDVSLSNRAIHNRIQDLGPMSFALKEEWEYVVEEIGMLMNTKRMVEKAFFVNEIPMLIATECQQTRDRRLPAERTQDCLQKKLEVNVVHSQFVKDSLELAIRVTEKHVKCLVDCKSHLEKERSLHQDLEIMIDNLCPKENSKNPGVIGAYTVESMRDLTLENINNSRRTRQASEKFRIMADNLTAKIANDSIALNDNVTIALKNRVHDVDIARCNYIGKLKEVTQEVERTESKINDLTSAMKALDVPYNITKSRLERSVDRPGMERTIDPARKAVSLELGNIEEAINALRGKMEESEQQLSELNDIRLDIEMKIAAKYQTLDIDNGKCVPMTSSFPARSKLLGH